MSEFVVWHFTGGRLAVSSEYVRELIRQDQDRQALRANVIDGAVSPLGQPVDEAHFERLRKRAQTGGGQADRR